MTSDGSITRSGLHYPNQIARIYFEAIEGLVGKPVMDAMLRRGGLAQYIDAYPPADLQRTFDFADFSALTAQLEVQQTIAPRQPSYAWEAGRLSYKGGLKSFGALAGFGRAALGFQVLPVPIKVKMGLQAMAMVYTTLSDQRTEVDETTDHFVYIIRACPMCMGRHADHPICEGAAALLAEGLHWVTERHYQVIEATCCARGDDACTFLINKTPSET